MTMIEKVARAIEDKHNEYHPVKDDYLKMAKAAINAMYVPTDIMIDAGHGISDIAATIYQAMIDQALKDG